MAASEDKLQLLRSLLSEKPDMGMKEANVIIREQFGTGVAPPQYSKVKKELQNDSAKDSETETVETPVAEEVAAPEVKSSPETEDKNEKESSDLESFFDGKAASEVSEKSDDQEAPQASENQEEEQAAEKPEVEPEEELPPAPTYPVKLEVVIPNAETVHLSGSFNKWKVEEHPLSKSGDNTWLFDGELPEGEHFYKFIVNKKVWHINLGQEYFQDPTGISHKIVVSAT